MEKIKVIAVVGPTASGKSTLAIKLTKIFNGEIISADSRQVYRGMDVGTGKIKPDKRLSTIDYGRSSKNKKPSSISHRPLSVFCSSGIRHHLLDVANPKRQFTVDVFKRLAKKAIYDIASRAKTVIVCGGTGLYVDTLIYDLPIPHVPPNKKLRAKLKKKSVAQLFAQLKQLDPDRAKTIDPHNPRRLIRALEIVITTKKPVPGLKDLLFKYDRSDLAVYNTLWLGINPGKELLAKRIAKRLNQRFEQGMTKEVAHLHGSGISWKHLESFGLEYRWIASYLQKKISKKEMRENLLRDIIRYSKHQMTWFKRNKNIRWVSDAHTAQQLVTKFIDQKTGRKIRRG